MLGRGRRAFCLRNQRVGDVPDNDPEGRLIRSNSPTLGRPRRNVFFVAGAPRSSEGGAQNTIALAADRGPHTKPGVGRAPRYDAFVMVYRTPAPRSREGAAPLALRDFARRLAARWRRSSPWKALPPLAFLALALASGWLGLRLPLFAEAQGYFALALAYAVSAACARHLWARDAKHLLTGGDEIGKKLAWTVALAVPMAGPVFYGALYEPPLPSDMPNRSVHLGPLNNATRTLSPLLAARRSPPAVRRSPLADW
jgi:hypothetical protein